MAMHFISKRFFVQLTLGLFLAAAAPLGAFAQLAPAKPQFPDGDTIRIGTGQPITYVPTTLQYMSQAYVKLTGVDISDDKLVDDFAAVNYCRVLTTYYKDEFAWRQAREAIRSTIIRNVESFPEYFFILGTMRLGRYDFEKKAFVLDDTAKLQRTGLFHVEDRSFQCGNYSTSHMPIAFDFRLTNPITLDKIDMPEQKAFAITREMDQIGNSARIVYVAFYVRINDFSTMAAGTTSGVDAYLANVRATLLSMRLYTDRERKKMIYEYTGE